MSKEENKAEEKANELIKIYSAVGLQQRDEGVECALLHCEGMIEEHEHESHDSYRLEFWVKVKQILTNK